ncbi:MAG: YggS family pyridoxal phosphate-dependent enzyme [Acidobacteria bacterium]|nr:YggS family pyridoxal phosphate-dependent enzyme [Acidobacteriota bacterium]
MVKDKEKAKHAKAGETKFDMTNPGRAAANPELGLSERLAFINQQIVIACARAGRSATEVTLVGVTKTIAPALIKAALESGLRVLGENRVQEAAAKITGLSDATSQFQAQWHLIGHLQSNKARRAVELFDAVHSVDELKLAERLNSIAGELGKRLPVLIEVNLGGEGSKSGVTPGEVLALCERADKLINLELRGLMALPPFIENPEEMRPFFRRLRELRDQAQRAGVVGEHFNDLSMGMSNDFEVAIEEGATFIRVGTAIFGPRA